MRNVINKGLTEEDILRGSGEAFARRLEQGKAVLYAGSSHRGTMRISRASPIWRKKSPSNYYEIPKEQRNGKCQITVSTSFFVPKPFTPFQWAPMNTREEFLGKAYTVNHTIKDQLNQKSIKYNWHEADVTLLEGLLARGDRRVGRGDPESL